MYFISLLNFILYVNSSEIRGMSDHNGNDNGNVCEYKQVLIE